jgi:predicted phosphodiesterase
MHTPSRRSFLTTSGLLAGSPFLLDSALDAAEPAEGFRMLSAPVLTNPADDAVTILWATNHPATGWIEYGETEKLGQRFNGDRGGLLPFDDRAFKLRLAGLKPGTKYYYRAHAVRVDFKGPYNIRRLEMESAASEVYSFTTPNPKATEVKFTVWNDTHEVADTVKQLHAAHEKDPGDFLLWNGDQTNDVSTEERMIAQFLAGGIAPIAARVPYYYVRGNHDVRGPGARNLPRFTDVANGQYYYSFRRGPLAAIVLDTGEDKPDDHPVYGGLNGFAAFRSEQASWLAKEIEKPEMKEARIKVLFCHIPLRWKNEKSVGSFCKDGRDKWHDLLVKWGAQVVISGHTHSPAWLPADKDFPYGQLIGGGPKATAATIIRGRATAEGLTLVESKLNGEVLFEVKVG